MKKRALGLVLSFCLVFSAVPFIAACTSSKGNSQASYDNGKVYFLCNKPEQIKQWEALAQLYTSQTGTPVTVFNASSGQYDVTLKSEMAKTNAPTMFQVNGPVGFSNWKRFCYDLTNTDVAKQITSEEYVLKDGDQIKGLAYAVETYGIMVNKKLLEKAGYQVSDINNFYDLAYIAQDIQSRKDQLGFVAFTSMGMDPSSSWRVTAHLANMPIYYEYKQDGIDSTDAIKGTYLPQFKQIFDLYLNNSTCLPTEISSKTADDATAEFMTDKAVFYQNGSWGYAKVAEKGDDNLAVIPLYIGADGEENQGLATGSENFWVVNSNSSPKDIDATLKFMYWLVTDPVAIKAIGGTTGAMPDGSIGMGNVMPFKQAIKPDNIFFRTADALEAQGKDNVKWCFSTIPSELWKTNLRSAMVTYASTESENGWANVVEKFVDGWATEAASSR